MSGTDYIPVGYVRRAHGVRGDVVVRGLISDAADRLITGGSLTAESGTTYTIESHRHHQGDVIVHLAGVGDRSAAEALIGTRFVIHSDERRALEGDEWWAEDLLGAQVLDVRGTAIGEVTDVIVGAAQDRLVVTASDGRIAQVPFVDALVPEVDTDRRTVTVDLPEGLFE